MISKASGQQQAIGSDIFRKSKVTDIFSTAEGVGTPTPVLFKGQLYM